MTKIILKYKVYTLFYIIMSVSAIVAMSFLTLSISNLFSAAQSGNVNIVMKLFCFIFFCFIGIRLTEYLADLLSIFIINSIRIDIKNKLFNFYIKKDITSYVEKNCGEYIADFTNDITILETKHLNSCKELITYVITIVSASTAIATIDLNMFIVIVFGVVLCVIIPFLTSKQTTKPMTKFINDFESFVQGLKDYFSAFFMIKNYAIEDRIIKRFAFENRTVENQKFEAEYRLIFTNNLIGRMAWMIELFVIVIGLIGVMRGKLSIGDVFTAYLLANSIGIPMQFIVSNINNIKSVNGILKKGYDVKKEIESQNNFETIEFTNTPQINIKKLSFERSGNNVLNNINFSFLPNKKYLIIGKNGSGKSTLAKMITKNYVNYQGEITFDNLSIERISRIDLSKVISYSNETVSLISDTVLNNITLYKSIPDELLQKALELSCLDVPLEHNVGDYGCHLSSGERRKLEITRALLSDPKILIFDEVISTLDIETAYEIEKLILSFDNHTVIMVSNAFSGQLLPWYDEIILIDNGYIIAHGTHEYMLKNCDDYRDIYEIRCCVK